MIHTTFPRPFEDFPRPYEWIVADPPWPYRNKKTGGSMTSGSAAQYDVMTVDEIRTHLNSRAPTTYSHPAAPLGQSCTCRSEKW